MSVLIDLDFDEARRLKYEQGVAEHRAEAEQPFEGDPLAEAFLETLDLANYLEEDERRGNPVPVSVSSMVRSLAGWIQAEHVRRKTQ